MRRSRRSTLSMSRARERWEREDGAARLKDRVVGLVELTLRIEERFGSGAVDSPRHTRRVIVEMAPALFEIPCSHSACRDGGHDLTDPIIRALHARRTSFEGEDLCCGSLGHGQCGRVLLYDATAVYSDSGTSI